MWQHQHYDKKRNSSEGGKYETTVVENCSGYTVPLFFLYEIRKMKQLWPKKTLILANFTNNNKNVCFWPFPSSILRFHQNKKKIGTVT